MAHQMIDAQVTASPAFASKAPAKMVELHKASIWLLKPHQKYRACSTDSMIYGIIKNNVLLLMSSEFIPVSHVVCRDSKYQLSKRAHILKTKFPRYLTSQAHQLFQRSQLSRSGQDSPN